VEGDIDFAKDLAQAILVSHLDMIAAVLDLLGVPHENGFFAKDLDPKPFFTQGWEERVYEKFRSLYPEAVLVFYMNHLRWELLGAEEVFRPAASLA
jgi:arylsulfatase A-like enzyme